MIQVAGKPQDELSMVVYDLHDEDDDIHLYFGHRDLEIQALEQKVQVQTIKPPNLLQVANEKMFVLCGY